MQLHALLLATASIAARIPLEKRASPSALSDVTIFDPPSDYNVPRTLYARNVQLPNGDLLATWENYSPEPPAVYFPIYRSSDYGQTWTEISQVQDTVNGYGLRYQPFLYYLNESIGSYDAGTLLLAGNSIPTNLSSTHIDLYASTDEGITWEFVSNIAAGGEAEPDNGLTPVWEPFLMAYNGKLICYYSDQRDNTTYGQKLVHQLPNGEYLYIYEYGSYFDTTTYSFPLYYRRSSDPEDFASATGERLVVSSGTEPTSSPYVTWTSYGGTNGTIIASSGSYSTLFINQALGEGEWTEISCSEGTSYSRSLRVLSESNEQYLLVNGAGVSGGTSNSVTVTVVDLGDSL
ncbi:hypothetical protein N7462_006179 [Penicillium macrosclerotiorum]|uniref:uncharacterized protein n=1 Tax=Penicillium macrosclerotiorum TaxID=303699 RepID=UPI0025472164|nr:uncharacterized protein N7462_006179 [Penicillium macrosclerotiorum]KAJ5683014.1 hypothetical protein N7462_006179 [Penicillium macrosclerotiorum]